MTSGVRERAVEHEAVPITSRPTWFGPESGPMAGWWHAPVDSMVRGIVVLCPPVGLEFLISYRALRVTADSLARAGLGVLRFSYPTTGDSAGAGDEAGRVERWRDGVREAVAWARQAGRAPVVLVGLRLGATLAADAAAELDGLAGVVLWDPCASGRSFLREEEALFRLGVPEHQRIARTDGTREGPGVLYGPTEVAALGGLGMERLCERLEGTDPDSPGTVLALLRSGIRPVRAIRDLTELPRVRRADVVGQEELFDWIRLRVPEEAIAELVTGVSRMAAVARVDVAPSLREEAVVARTPDGRVVRERFVRLGAARMAAVVTESEGGGTETIVLTNAAPPACHVGPARLWVDLARRWAAERGVRVVRVDESGVGDSPGGDVPSAPPVYTDAVVGDLAEVVRAVRSDGAASVTLVGLCAAAWAGLRAAAQVHVDMVCAVNPSVWDVRPPDYLTRPRNAGVNDMQVGRVPTRRTWRTRTRELLRRLLLRLAPEPVWWRLGQAGRVEAPAGMIVPLISRGMQVRLLFGPREKAIFLERRGARLLRRHGGPGMVQMQWAMDVDHALMSQSARRAVVDVLSDWVSEGRSGPSAREDRASHGATATECGAARHD